LGQCFDFPSLLVTLLTGSQEQHPDLKNLKGSLPEKVEKETNGLLADPGSGGK